MFSDFSHKVQGARCPGMKMMWLLAPAMSINLVVLGEHLVQIVSQKGTIVSIKNTKVQLMYPGHLCERVLWLNIFQG